MALSGLSTVLPALCAQARDLGRSLVDACCPFPGLRQALLVLLVVLFLELPNLRFVFALRYTPLIQLAHWDEWHLLVGLDRGHGLADVLGWFVGDWPEGNGFYRPLAGVSLWLDYLLWGWNANAYLLTNWLIHGLVAVALIYLTAALTLRRDAAALAGALFAIVPTHGSLAILQVFPARTDGLCALFYLACLYWALRFMREGRGLSLSLATASALAAALSKEMAVTLPVTVALCWACAAQRPPLRRLLPLLVVLLGVIAVWLVAYRAFVPERLSGGFEVIPNLPRRTLARLWSPLARAVELWLGGGMGWLLLGGVGRAWHVVAEAAVLLLALGLVARLRPATAAFWLLWGPLTALPLLTVHADWGWYLFIPQMAIFVGWGMALALALERLRQPVCRASNDRGGTGKQGEPSSNLPTTA